MGQRLMDKCAPPRLSVSAAAITVSSFVAPVTSEKPTSHWAEIGDLARVDPTLGNG